MSRRFEAISGLMKKQDVVLNIICLILAIAFMGLAISNLSWAGNFFTIDSLFMTTVFLLLAAIFVINPAMWAHERGLLKNPFGHETEMDAIVDTTPVHFEGTTRLFLSILGYLLGLTLIEVFLAYIQIPLHLMLTILIGLSLIKAALIVAYFMHLRFERMSLVLTLVPMLVVCICLLLIFFPDSMRLLNMRGYR